MKKYINIESFYLSGSLIEPGKSVITEKEYNALTPEGKALYAEQKPDKSKETKKDAENVQP